MVTRNRARPTFRLRAGASLVCVSVLIGGCSVSENPYESQTVHGDEAVELIDSMRPGGSYEDARRRINDAAATIAERIVGAVPGQTWQFSPDPNVQQVKSDGLPCDKLTGDIARRPLSDMVEFGRPFTSEEFATASDIVRDEAAEFGADGGDSLFNEQSRRDFHVRGGGFEFDLRQGGSAILTITGDCFLMQSVIDSPAGQLPADPEPSTR